MRMQCSECKERVYLSIEGKWKIDTYYFSRREEDFHFDEDLSKCEKSTDGKHKPENILARCI